MEGRVFDGHELDVEGLSFEHPVMGLLASFRPSLPSWATQVFHQS